MAINRIKKLYTMVFAAFLTLFVFGSVCLADTFTHRQTKEVLHGYLNGVTDAGKAVANTQEKGFVRLNLVEWEVTPDRLGRNNKVVVLTIDMPIIYEIETAALEQVISETLRDGPLFILLEIDTPGGRIDYTQRICRAITNTSRCPVIAFVRGGEFGGAISAGAAVAFACNKIYMANNTIIGAAAAIALSQTGEPEELKKSYGEEVAEKFSSAWRAYLASLAEQNHRPGLLARAMVDRDIEVVEVRESDKRFFVEPVNQTAQQQLVRTWNKKGSLLTLTATEAQKCGIADKVLSSREDILRDLDAAKAKVVVNDCIQKAGLELKRAMGQLNRIRKSIDLKIKEADNPSPAPKVLSVLNSARSEFKALIKLAKKYPDLQLDIRVLEDELNSIEAQYQKVRMDLQRR